MKEECIIEPATATGTRSVELKVAVVVGAIAILLSMIAIILFITWKLQGRANARKMEPINRCLEDVPRTTGRRRQDAVNILPDLPSDPNFDYAEAELTRIRARSHTSTPRH
uniref:Uncharacterized protein n=1 Tax=Physcomitrium patens TaxID=3218 RepID=A0A2K1L3P3_PHYPA|nr:hypothetical protein PHYPA_003441 [Physcomitrium patens]